MNELGSRTGTACERRAAARTSRWGFPLTIKAMLLDLDGTMMPSYKTLAAIQYIEEQLAINCRKPSSFIDYCSTRNEFHSLLHKPGRARRAAIDYASRNNIDISPAVLRTMNSLQEQSFCLYDGLRDLLDHARDKGVFVGIYTSTSSEFAIRRMHGSLLPPSSVHALWARDNESSLINSIDADALFQDYTRILIPYRYSKPDDTPLRELSTLSGAGPNEILFIGEGLNDLEVVYRDPTDPRAIFCFQEKGAADICDKTSALNAYLRPDHIPLGAGAVNSKIDQYDIERDIIRLNNGFVDLMELIDEGQIRLAAPKRLPTVWGNRLTPGFPHSTRTPQPDLDQRSRALSV
jgi:phosphoglycolate phosphatase-like HAD superfamily hydrolase